MGVTRLLILFIFGLIGYNSFSQISVIEIDEELTYPFSGSSIAINPKDPSNIVVSTNINRIYVSLDSGATWLKIFIEPTEGITGTSKLIVDKRGNFYLFTLLEESTHEWNPSNIDGPIVVFSSKDKGLSWSRAGEIGKTENYRKESVSGAINLSTGEMYATWLQYGNDNLELPSPNIYFSSSTNGDKWSKPTEIVYEPHIELGTNPFIGPVPIAGPGDIAYVAWSQNEKLLFDRSYNRGKTWLRNDIVITDIVNNGEFEVEGFNGNPGALTAAADMSTGVFYGTLYYAWSDQRGKDLGSDIYIVKSNNKGDFWTRPTRVNFLAKDKYQYSPTLAIDPINGMVYMAWLDKRDREGTENDLYLGWSLDGGNSFKQIKINSEPVVLENITFQNPVISLTAYRGILCASWVEVSNDKTRIKTTRINYKQLGIN